MDQATDDLGIALLRWMPGDTQKARAMAEDLDARGFGSRHVPSDDEIMQVLGLTAASTTQLCDRLRDLFAGSQERHLVTVEVCPECGNDEATTRITDGRHVCLDCAEKLDGHRRGLTLRQMQAEVHEVNLANGWFATDRTFGEGMALIHSEVSEALEAYRRWKLADVTQDSDGSTLPKPEGVGSEYADIFIRLLDQCERDKVDLDFEYDRKIAYNRTRGYRHGNKGL